MWVLYNDCYGGFRFSDEFITAFYKLYPDTKPRYLNKYDVSDDCRTDPLVNKLVREFGCDKASGPCAKLAMTEIPDGARFKIKEYDGAEWIKVKLGVECKWCGATLKCKKCGE